MKKTDLINIVTSYLGMVEGTTKHTTFVKEYNTLCVPLARSYSLKTSDSWCAAFSSVCMTKAGEKRFNEVGAQEMANKFKKLSSYTTDKTKPQAGDIIFYDWQNNNWIDHVGIIVERNGDTLKVIEGNSSDMVKYRTIDINNKNIVGFGILTFESETKTEDTTETDIKTWIEHLRSDLTKMENELK